MLHDWSDGNIAVEPVQASLVLRDEYSECDLARDELPEISRRRST